uniref:Prolyl 3-hydroxylase family member 4 (inactive) n=1 Tax=Salarias fasciatus TaxID=181472 RepID=A0A672F918_SALFA
MIHLVLTFLCATFVCMTAAQYENYSFRSFPGEELVPLTAAYGMALGHYAAGNWTESIRYFELSLRVHRLLRDSARQCALRCNREKRDEESVTGDPRASWHLLRRASCQKSCRAHLPALQLQTPERETLEEFSRRAPYRYLHFAHAKLNDLQRAVPCAYTFLQRNPEDEEMQQLMEEYKREYDLSGFLTDHEERPHEASFLRGVKLVISGDYGRSVEHLEEALKLYLHEYELCQADCEATGQLSPHKDFYAGLADVLIDVLRCQLKCEDDLIPNVGGYFVENFMATLYHYLQYSYYKLNDGRSAVPCVYSYFLFEPEDQVMKQNLQYYKAYSQQWGLQSSFFTPRTEALKYYNQTIARKQMLTSAEYYLNLSAEDFLGPEGAALLASDSPDAEFEGVGDYEESMYANWRQPKGKGDTGMSD